MQLQTALRELEMITDHLSKKDVDVEAGLKKFKEGVDLIKFCRSQLQKAENEFKKLMVKKLAKAIARLYQEELSQPEMRRLYLAENSLRQKQGKS